MSLANSPEGAVSDKEAEVMVRSAWEKRVLQTVELAKSVRQEAGLDYCIGAIAELIASRRRELERIDKLVAAADNMATKAKLIDASAKLARAVMDGVKELERLTALRAQTTRNSQPRNRTAAPGHQVSLRNSANFAQANNAPQ